MRDSLLIKSLALSLILGVAAIAPLSDSHASLKNHLSKRACERSSAEAGFAAYESFADETTNLVTSGSSGRIEYDSDKPAKFLCMLKKEEIESVEVPFNKVFAGGMIRAVTPAETNEVELKKGTEFEIYRNSDVAIHSIAYKFKVSRARRVGSKIKDEMIFSGASKFRISTINADGTSSVTEEVILVNHEKSAQKIEVPGVGKFEVKCEIQ